MSAYLTKMSRSIPLLALLILCAVGQAHGKGGVPPGNCFNNSAQCMIAAGTAYITAIVSQNPNDVNDIPLAPDCRRRENAVDRGDSADEIRSIILSRVGTVLGPRDLRWFVDEQQRVAIAYYLLDVAGTSPQQTAHIAEKFTVEHGQITEIEAIFVINNITDSGF